jgi:hypothetical protein
MRCAQPTSRCWQSGSCGRHRPTPDPAVVRPPSTNRLTPLM